VSATDPPVVTRSEWSLQRTPSAPGRHRRDSPSARTDAYVGRAPELEELEAALATVVEERAPRFATASAGPVWASSDPELMRELMARYHRSLAQRG
jgi:hypothetical protein